MKKILFLLMLFDVTMMFCMETSSFDFPVSERINHGETSSFLNLMVGFSSMYASSNTIEDSVKKEATIPFLEECCSTLKTFLENGEQKVNDSLKVFYVMPLLTIINGLLLQEDMKESKEKLVEMWYECACNYAFHLTDAQKETDVLDLMIRVKSQLIIYPHASYNEKFDQLMKKISSHKSHDYTHLPSDDCNKEIGNKRKFDFIDIASGIQKQAMRVESKRTKKSFCCAIIKSYNRLLSHIKEMHNENEKYSCISCKASFELPDELIKHLSVDHFLFYVCCNKIFTSELYFNEHKANCNLLLMHNCCRNCKKYNTLFNHIRKKHCSSSNYRCDLCEQSYSRTVDLIHHLSDDHQLLYSCSCLKLFTTQEDLSKHITDDCNKNGEALGRRTMRGDRITCSCKKKHNSGKDSTIYHIKTCHAVEQGVYECPYCPSWRSDSLSGVFYHMREIHFK